MTRLIALPAAEKRLLSAVGAVPAGVKISIPQLRDHLVSQRDVLDALQALIDKGKLDRATLRPPVKAAAPDRRGFALGDGEPSKPLFDALKAEGARRGLSVQALSLAVWGNKARIYQLRAAETVRRSTADKIRAWIASGPIISSGGPSDAAGEGEPARKLPRAPAPDSPPDRHPSGAELADELIRHCEQHGLALNRVGFRLFGARNGIDRLRATRRPRARMIERIRDFLAHAPSAELKVQPSGGPRVAQNGGVTGAELAAELDALIEKHGLSKTRVGLHLNGNCAGLGVLRHSNPRKATVEKVRAMLADPPLELLRAKVRVAPPRQPIAVKGVHGLPSIEVHDSGGCAPPVLTAPAGPKLTFEEQLARVERGEVGITANIKIGRPDPSGTLGGVTGEINL